MGQKYSTLEGEIVLNIDETMLNKFDSWMKHAQEGLNGLIQQANQFKVATPAIPKQHTILKQNLQLTKEQAKVAQANENALAAGARRGKAEDARKRASLKEQERLEKKAIADEKRKAAATQKTAAAQRKVTRATKTAAAWNSRILNTLAKIRVFAGLVKFAFDKIAIALTGIIGGASGITFLVDRINAATTRINSFAASLNVGANTLEALGTFARMAGLDIDRVGDNIEEMNNKFGNMKAGIDEITAREGLQNLGLDFERDILQLEKVEDQYFKVMGAAQQLISTGKDSDFQKAVAGIDQIFSGEGNKLAGFLKTLDEPFDVFIQRQKDLQFLTEDARKSADKWTFSSIQLKGALGSIAKQFVSLFGDKFQAAISFSLAMLQKYRKEIAENIVKAVDKAVDWFYRFLTAAAYLYRVLKTVAEVTLALADAMWIFISSPIGKVLLTLTAIFVAYKIAVIAATIANNLFVKSQMQIRAISVLSRRSLTLAARSFRLLGTNIMIATRAGWAFLTTNPIGWALLAIGAIAGLVYWFRNLSDEWKGLATLLLPGLALLSAGFDLWLKGIKYVWKFIMRFVNTVKKGWAPAMAEIREEFRKVSEEAEPLLEVLRKLSATVLDAIGFNSWTEALQELKLLGLSLAEVFGEDFLKHLVMAVKLALVPLRVMLAVVTKLLDAGKALRGIYEKVVGPGDKDPKTPSGGGFLEGAKSFLKNVPLPAPASILRGTVTTNRSNNTTDNSTNSTSNIFQLAGQAAVDAVLDNMPFAGTN